MLSIGCFAEKLCDFGKEVTMFANMHFSVEIL